MIEVRYLILSTGRYLPLHPQYGRPQCHPCRIHFGNTPFRDICLTPPDSLHKVNIDDGFLSLMSPDGNAKDDVKLPEGDLGQQINAAFDDGKELLVTIVSAMGEEQVRISTTPNRT